MRLFIAIDIPESIKKQLAGILVLLQKNTAFDGRFVAVNQLHITLLFLGSVSEEIFKKIDKVLSDIRYQSLNACIGQLGIFEKKDIPRIIYCSVDVPDLAELVSIIREKVASWVKLDIHSPFMSHVTLVRITHMYNRKQLYEGVQRITFAPLSFSINQFVLKESVLSSQGSLHYERKAYPLHIS